LAGRASSLSQTDSSGFWSTSRGSRGEAEPENLQTLLKAAGEAGVTVIDRIMRREESYALIDACDAYVSLHRSEGFGLTMAEAMLMGKPVIASGYSGNLDFMSADNSLLVNCDRVAITQDLPFYRKGSFWAEPRYEHAAAHMRWVYTHLDEARQMGARAKAELDEMLSLEAAGQRMAARLYELEASRHAAVEHRRAA
jgi:glycosyltransferase involved in cell wall biosynthesis